MSRHRERGALRTAASTNPLPHQLDAVNSHDAVAHLEILMKCTGVGQQYTIWRGVTSRPAARSNLLTAMIRLHSLTLTGSASFSILGWKERVWVLTLGFALFAFGFFRKDILAEMPVDKEKALPVDKVGVSRGSLGFLPGRKDIFAAKDILSSALVPTQKFAVKSRISAALALRRC